jgi:hypothetical protein
MTLLDLLDTLNLDRESGLGLKPRILYSRQNVAGKGSNEYSPPRSHTEDRHARRKPRALSDAVRARGMPVDP